MKHKGAGARNVRITLGAAAAIGVAGALAVPALARGNSKNGEKVFVEHCSACHFEFKAYGNNVGPNLISVTGRKAGSFKGFLYSDGMKAKSHIWTEANLLHFVAGPYKMVPDTEMGFDGFEDTKLARDLIAYLKSVQCK